MSWLKNSTSQDRTRIRTYKKPSNQDKSQIVMRWFKNSTRTKIRTRKKPSNQDKSQEVMRWLTNSTNKDRTRIETQNSDYVKSGHARIQVIRTNKNPSNHYISYVRTLLMRTLKNSTNQDGRIIRTNKSH